MDKDRKDLNTQPLFRGFFHKEIKHMTFELKKKSVLNAGYPIYCLGHCKIHAIVSSVERAGWISSPTGWDCDVYDGGNVIVTTGYRPFGERLEKELETLVERLEAACRLCKRYTEEFQLLANLCYLDYKVHKEGDKTYSGVLENTVEKINYYIETCEKEAT